MQLEGLTYFENHQLNVDFFAEKRVYSDEKVEKVVEPLFANINKLNSVAFIGRNATGKTVTLNLITDILKVYVNNESISGCEYLPLHFDDLLEIKVSVLVNKKLYHIISIVKKNKMEQLQFVDEKIYEKNADQSISKSNLLKFTENNLFSDRKEIDNPFLKNDDSLFSGVLNQVNIHDIPLLFDMGHFTNFNFPLFMHFKIPTAFINYLDPSIEYIEVLNKNQKQSDLKFKLKFKNSDTIITDDISRAEKYLSSGTIKGLNIFAHATITLRSGGYLLIDEIENHLNKSIVINMIDLFTSKINKNGATLLFTTHYSEILDSIERSDSIYVLEKQESIILNKFSKRAKNNDRIDKKKSDIIMSGKVGTAPSYLSFRQMKKQLKNSLQKEVVND